MQELDLRVLRKNMEDAMYALADAQAQMRTGIWLIEQHLRMTNGQEADRASVCKSE